MCRQQADTPSLFQSFTFFPLILVESRPVLVIALFFQSFVYSDASLFSQGIMRLGYQFFGITGVDVFVFFNCGL